MDDISRAASEEKHKPSRSRKKSVPARDEEGMVEAPAVAEPELEAAVSERAGEPDLEVELPAVTDPAELARILMAVLLVAREPISRLRLAQICGTTQEVVAQGLAQLQETLRAQGFPLELSATGDSVRLLTLPEVYPYLVRLRGVKKAERLSAAALETLAVIAYRQPVMRAEIEAIRGVKVGPTLRTLLDHKLIDAVGRADVPGRPLQYGTTAHFLDRFGLASIKDLPSVKELRALS